MSIEDYLGSCLDPLARKITVDSKAYEIRKPYGGTPYTVIGHQTYLKNNYLLNLSDADLICRIRQEIGILKEGVEEVYEF